MYLGFDCSTQSFSAQIIDPNSGELVCSESVRFETDLPQYSTTSGFVSGTQQGEVFSYPTMWLDALELLLTKLQQQGAPLAKVIAISGSAQQHATVYLKSSFEETLATLSSQQSLAEQIEPQLARDVAPIWMDSSTQTECEEIATALGGNEEVCRRSGSIATPRFAGPQIRRFSQQNPQAWQETGFVHLASSFLASILTGKPVAIDWGDGAGMNLMNLATRSWDECLLNATATKLHEKLPPLQSSHTQAGNISPYFVEKYGFSAQAKSILWSGDNPCSLVGMGTSSSITPVISLGTSYTFFTSLGKPVTDPAGYAHVFGNPCGEYMGLICFHNGALGCQKLKEHQQISWEEFDQQAQQTPQQDQEIQLPFLEAEITPKAHPMTLQHSVRSLLDGQFLSMKLHCSWMGTLPTSIRVTGGLSQSKGVCQTIANVFNATVCRIETSNSASLGAAIRAAHSINPKLLPQLEQQFCQPLSSSKIYPNQEAVAYYQKIMPAFEAKLKQHLHSATAN